MVERSPEQKRPIVKEDRIVAMMRRAIEARQKKEGIFAEEIIPPEKPFIDQAKAYGEKIGDQTFALHAVFFITTIVFADNSTRQFRHITSTENSPFQSGFFPKPDRFSQYAWLFKPERVIKTPEEIFEKEVREFTRPWYNAIALRRWQHNARVLLDRYDGDLRNFFDDHDYDAPKIFDALKGPKRKTGWQGFHRFGEKLGRLFLQWVGQYELAQLEHLDEIGIPVDFQIARLIIQTGGIKLDKPTHKHWVQDGTLVPLLPQLLKEIDEKPSFISETLWLIGSRCCNEYQHNLCPLAEMCDRLISRAPLDQDGLFDPQDVGRWETKKTVTAKKKREKQLAAGQKELPI